MRIRTIKPEFYSDEDLCELPALTRILFTGLWGLSDCEGRQEYRPKFIKVQVLPYDNCEIESMLEQLRSAGFIKIYSVGDREYIQVVNFKTHQRIMGKEAENQSKLPPPPSDETSKKKIKKRGNNGENSGINGEASENAGKEGKGKEKEGKEISAQSAAPPARPLHVQFVEGFQSVYQSATGSPFKIDTAHWVIADRLVKNYGYEECVRKAKVLGVLCQQRSAWFTKDGPASFTLETLSSKWNSIIPESIPKTKESEVLSELKKREEMRVRGDAIIANGSSKTSNS